jgi:hypothetical protein
MNGGRMATIRKRGPGGGKKANRLRINRTWLIKTVLAQQDRLNALEEALAKKSIVLDSEAINSMPVSIEPARRNLPEPLIVELGGNTVA